MVGRAERSYSYDRPGALVKGRPGYFGMAEQVLLRRAEQVLLRQTEQVALLLAEQGYALSGRAALSSFAGRVRAGVLVEGPSRSLELCWPSPSGCSSRGAEPLSRALLAESGAGRADGL
ncbi:hypothetical protein BVRB_8g192310 [Beta vulgaris subsp. vulgaris]|nr:hypothetical protein BVRB_8g192310 [Beta vulgaris subsp. vulgaris]